MQVLVVCHANVCRSRVAEVLLAQRLAPLGATVVSAGVEVGDAPDDGLGLCPSAAAYLRERGLTPTAYPPRELTAELVEQCDLVLTLDREVGGAVASLAPRARSRTFRLMWAATAATYVAGFVAAGELPPGASPIDPAWDLDARWRWLVAELDAARGHLGSRHSQGTKSFYDIDDAHTTAITHPDVFERITAACDQLAGAAALIAEPPVYAHH